MAGQRIVVELVVDGTEAELAADALWLAGASAVGEATGSDGRVRLTAEVDPAGLDDRWPWQPVAVDDGVLDAWRAHARTVRAGRHVVLHPAWQPAPPVGEHDVVVRLDPGRAFGSGSHPSTRLCAAALEAHLVPGQTVLDVGCGSGVLSVLAACLGASSAVAVDLDPVAVAATEANAAANGVTDLVAVRAGSVDAVDGRFDVVVANIGLGVLRDLAPELVVRTAPGGLVVVAGLLPDQVEPVVAALAGCRELERLEEEGWAASVLRRGA
ncbi:MAG TPA: 50S ribosomal protein L11 methyltransferase [Acidimicrobiales bacterium]|nr:50S ribosomal protein L11 methyltransferase [Acidimicrobiales bacterium]